MSRSYCSYDEEWQRRKSVLIRSLFHDIPILSPVEEESNDSSQDYYAPTREPFPSPPRPYSPLPPLIIEKVPKVNKHDEPEEYYTKLHKRITKIYVKLFIEKRNLSSITSNEISDNGDHQAKSDDSDSVKTLDLRFLESISPGNKDLDSINEDEEPRESSDSENSNGYGADYESMDTAIVDVVNNTTSNEDAEIISQEEESDSEYDGDLTRNKNSDNWRSSKNKRNSRERTDNRVSSEKLNSEHSTIDDQEMFEIEKSKEVEDEHSYEEEESNNENIDEHEETNKTKEYDRIRIDDPDFDGDESCHSTINDQEMTDSEDSRTPENEHQTENNTQTVLGFHRSEKTDSEGGNGDVETGSSSADSDYRQITTIALVHFDGFQDTGDGVSRVYEDSVKSVILPMTFKRVVSRSVNDEAKGLEELEEKDDPNTAPTYSDEGESSEENFEEMRTLLDTIGDDILAIRASTPKFKEKDLEPRRTPNLDTPEEGVEGMNTHQPETDEDETEEEVVAEMESSDLIEQMRAPGPDLSRGTMPVTHRSDSESVSEHTAFLRDATMMTSPSQDGADETGEEIDVEMESLDQIEQMRTPRPDLSRGTMPVTHRSGPESVIEHTAFPQEATMMTTPSQDGAEQNISNLQTSNEINDILTSIFNESGSKTGTPVSGRKRKLADKSVQAVPAMRVTWEDMRSNFFVGSPKIFRLCACTDHTCL